MGRRSHQLVTWLGEAVATARHAPASPPRLLYQWRRGILRARGPEQHSGMPSGGFCFEPCKADVSQRWEDAHTNWSRGWLRLWLRHDTLLGAPRDFCTCGVAVVVALEAPEQYSGMPSRGISTLEPCKADVSQRCEDAHTNWSLGLVRLWLRHDTLLGAHRDLRTSGVAVSFALEHLSNTPACLPDASPRTLDLSRARPM